MVRLTLGLKRGTVRRAKTSAVKSSITDSEAMVPKKLSAYSSNFRSDEVRPSDMSGTGKAFGPKKAGATLDGTERSALSIGV